MALTEKERAKYTRGFLQYHRMRTRQNEYLNAPMGWMKNTVVSCGCFMWEESFEWKPDHERGLRPAPPVEMAWKKHLEQAWGKRTR